MKKQTGEIIFNVLYKSSIIMLLRLVAGAVSTNDAQVFIGLGSIFVGLISASMIAVYEVGMVED